MKQIILGLVVVLSSCSTPNPSATCSDGTCKDPAFPYCDSSGAVSGDPGACIAVSCTPGEIKSCQQDQALTCNATGNGYDLAPCQLGCADSPSPHCKYLQPRYLPSACDQTATDDALVASSTGSIDPNLDSACTGGVFDQSAVPDVCVVHYKTISIEQGITLSILGKADSTGRSVALIADDDLVIDGTLDVSGHKKINGPGGGALISGSAPGSMNTDSDSGGGGAGGATAGAAGGLQLNAGGGTNGGGAPGGAATANPALLAEFVGGGASYITDFAPIEVRGGGGGAVMLISCHGAVRITGVVNAGGGGGVGGALAFLNTAGFGGGAGGVVSIEGADISLTGSLFANGGGGGAGTVNGVFADGEDGSMSDSVPAHGGMVANAGSGGNGGFAAAHPAVGQYGALTNSSPGGGGGSVGFLQIFAPSGSTPTITPAHVSPPLPPTGSALTR